MTKYIGYEVRAFAQVGGTRSKPVYERVSDEQAELFAIYGHVRLFHWEWVEEVPTRAYGEARIRQMRGAA